MTRLSAEFWARPFAHRGLHERAAGRPENSMAAFEAAITQGYAIELDVQPSADGEAMVFHDYTMERLTAATGRIEAQTAETLRETALTGGGTIPDLASVLAMIAGRVPVLIETKDQSGDFGETDGALERRVCDIVRAGGYARTCAVMSFNPYAIKMVQDYAPELMRGLVSYDFEHPHDAHVPADHRRALADLTMLKDCAADFVSYGAISLHAPVIDRIRATGMPFFTWTIRSKDAATAALTRCDQVTFEGFLP